MKTEHICPHSVKVLEFDLILDTLASFASSDLGRKAAKGITPSTHKPWIEKRLGETTQLKALLDQGVRLPLSGLRDIGPKIRDLGLKQTLFEPQDLIEISDTLSVSGQMKCFLGRLSAVDYPLLQAMGDKLHLFEELTRRINHCVNGSDGILDRATESLQSIRRQLHALEGEIRRQFSRIVSDPQMRSALENDNFMLRHGRPVVALKSHYRTRLRGTVLDRSHSGATLYIEPDGLGELSNRLEETRFEEKKEIDNILWDLTHRVLKRRDDIFNTLRILAFVDLTYAKARFSTDYEMSAPHLGDSLRLNSARHPLLLQWASAEYDRPVRELDQRVIPISPRLGDDFDLLLVTGPNTGGKTVLLKTIGICQLMAQSGMHIPARHGSQVTVYRHLFADIGDEQSIQQSLSTFSAHMQNVIQILKQTNGQTLVLLDELGAGTDPTEGASLATAILDELLQSRGHVVATTHLGQLKTYAFARARAENACVQFDTQSLKPTYRLFIGTPGSSNALTIAERLGMPERVIRMAQDLLAQDSDGSSELINQVQATRELAERKRRRAENMLSDAQRVRLDATRRLAEVREERKQLQGQADQQVDDTMRRVRATIQGFDRKMANAPKPWHAWVQDLVRDISQLASSTPLAQRHQRFTEGLKKGDSVYVLPLRRSAIVDRIRRKRQSVQLLLDGKQIEVSFAQICQNA